MIAIVDPQASRRVIVGEGHAPLWQYFSRLRKKKALEPICAPKGAAPSAVVDSSCKSALSQGAEVGAMRADMDPQLRAAPSRDSWRRRSCPRCGSTC
jgi:hypothetical protein